MRAVCPGHDEWSVNRAGAKGLVISCCANSRRCLNHLPTPLAELLAFADGVTQTLAVARRLIEAGRYVDLTGLEDQVGLLCAKALDLPRPRAARCVVSWSPCWRAWMR